MINALLKQLFCAVEQLLAELLRNSRDRVRSRIPDRFAKLFKVQFVLLVVSLRYRADRTSMGSQQSKNWRKYFAAMERKCATTQDQLRATANKHEALANETSEARRTFSTLKDKLELCQTNEREYAKQVASWKRKLIKMKAHLDEKEAVVARKTRELQSISNDFQQFKRQQRSKELDAMLCSPQIKTDGRRERDDGKGEFSDKGQLAMLRADYITVKNQLVRSESDNLLLVRALDMARQNDGQLSAGISHEVSRIAIRITKDSRASN